MSEYSISELNINAVYIFLTYIYLAFQLDIVFFGLYLLVYIF